MKIPFDGKVNSKLMRKALEKKHFFYVNGNTKDGVSIITCVLSDADFDVENPLFKIVTTYEDGSEHISDISYMLDWNMMFDSYGDAKVVVDEYEESIKDFDFRPYITLYDLLAHKKDFMHIQKKIHEELSDYPNFIGIDFTDVNADGGIQVRGRHKSINGYTFGKQPTINYDFSNIDDVIEDFVSSWKKADNQEYVDSFNRFLEMGQKYGWD